MSHKKLYDQNLPTELKEIQSWFGSIISRPLEKNSKMKQLSPLGHPMEREAAKYIAKSPTLASHKRIEIYNQQYWWRLISAMQEGFPLLTRLFGYHEFNDAIAVPYLCAYPPKTWSLFEIGRDLPLWLDKSYKRKDRKLVVEVGYLEEAFNKAFVAKHELQNVSELLQIEELASQIFSAPITLQNHTALFCWDWDYIPFRQKFLAEEPSFWEDNEFPILEKKGPYCYCLYRNYQEFIVWEKISYAEYLFLSLFSKYETFEKICQQLEESPVEKEVSETIEAQLPAWIQKWFNNHWLQIKNFNKLSKT